MLSAHTAWCASADPTLSAQTPTAHNPQPQLNTLLKTKPSPCSITHAAKAKDAICTRVHAVRKPRLHSSCNCSDVRNLQLLPPPLLLNRTDRSGKSQRYKLYGQQTLPIAWQEDRTGCGDDALASTKQSCRQEHPQLLQVHLVCILQPPPLLLLLYSLSLPLSFFFFFFFFSALASPAAAASAPGERSRFCSTAHSTAGWRQHTCLALVWLCSQPANQLRGMHQH